MYNGRLHQTVVLCFALIYAYATAGFICFPGKFAFDNSGAVPLLSLVSITCNFSPPPTSNYRQM